MDPITSIVVALITAVASIVCAWMVYRQKQMSTEMHHQLKNSHTTNLREDIDEIKYEQRALSRLVAQHGHQLTQVSMRLDRVARGTVYGRARPLTEAVGE